ncbi:MAG: hypothetical protein DRR19_29365 [Candidatus Parabeggiatoa sp. nov. 1]|nr:MAG: hypothetical protein DRR19_29365 [Gammaproteobacteria bacterium]
MLLLEWLTKPETGELLSNEFPGFFTMHKKAPALGNKNRPKDAFKSDIHFELRMLSLLRDSIRFNMKIYLHLG